MANQTLRDWAEKYGLNVGWDPKTSTVTVGGKTYPAGNIPGTRLDPTAGRHIVTDPAALQAALGGSSSTGSKNTGSSTSSSSSSSSSSGTISPEKVEAELGMGGMLMPEMQVAYGGAPSGGYYVPTETGWTKTSTPPQSWTTPYEEARRQAEYWQTTPEAYTARNAVIDALQARIRQLENQLTNWQSLPLPSPTTWQSPSLPTQTPTPPPTVETAPQVENVPAAAAPQQATALPAGVSQGAGGFTYQASTPPVLPTVDKLMETYRQVFGRSDQDVQQYLQSPEFQSVLRGNVPMWMEADPMWRRYLQMLGISRRLQQNQ